MPHASQDFDVGGVEESTGRSVSESGLYRYSGLAGNDGPSPVHKAFIEASPFENLARTAR